MNEYDRTDKEPWPGFEWAKPSGETIADEMREALAGYYNGLGVWVDLIDDEAKIDALFEYLAEPKHGYDIDENDYHARTMAAMFEARCVEYDDGYYKVGREYLDDHYGKVYKDPIVGMTEEDIKQVGANLAGSEHESERYMWVEADDGRVFAIVRPAYADKEGNRT